MDHQYFSDVKVGRTVLDPVEFRPVFRVEFIFSPSLVGDIKELGNAEPDTKAIGEQLLQAIAAARKDNCYKLLPQQERTIATSYCRSKKGQT